MLSTIIFLWRYIQSIRIILQLQKNGVVFKNFLTNYVDGDVLYIGPGTVIYPGVTIEGKTIIGNECVLGPNAYIKESYVGPRSQIGHNAQLVRSSLGERVNAKHFCYIGDAEVGDGSNIGAGTVFCNYDGSKKNQITLGKHVFIGSGSMIVAPVQIGDESFIAANSTVTKNVPPNTLVIARGEKQINKPERIRFDEKGWHILKKPATS